VRKGTTKLPQTPIAFCLKRTNVALNQEQDNQKKKLREKNILGRDGGRAGGKFSGVVSGFLNLAREVDKKKKRERAGKTVEKDWSTVPTQNQKKQKLILRGIWWNRGRGGDFQLPSPNPAKPPRLQIRRNDDEGKKNQIKNNERKGESHGKADRRLTG